MKSFISIIHDYFIYYRYLYWQWCNRTHTNYLNSLKIMSREETIDYIVNNKCSISRYGDGEFLIMSGNRNGFQKENERLAEKLKEVFRNPIKNLLICIPSFLTDTSPFVLKSKIFSLGFNHSHLSDAVIPFVPTNILYGDSLLSRFYMNRKDKSYSNEYVNILKKIWDKEDLLIVEGKYSRLGVGNDLLDNAKSIKRILCPKENAFDRYDDILKTVKNSYKGELVILALGMTATILAYDLSKQNIRALDLGHIDIEYEWLRIGAKKKVPIPHKQMSEIGGGGCTEESIDKTYLSQIIGEVI